MRNQMSLRTLFFAISLGILFMGQFVTAIPPGEPPVEPTPPPPPPRPSDAQGWLCLNGEEVRWSSTDSFSFAATYRSWVVAAVEGCDQASFSLKRKGVILQDFIVRPGYVLCQPYEFDNRSWPENVPPADALDEYCIQIDPAQAKYYTMLAVLPQVLAEGNGTVNLAECLRVPFRGAGRVHCLFAGNFSITELAVCLEVEGGDPIFWKQNNYTGSDRYPVQIGEFVTYVQGGQYLQFDADLPAGDHALLLKGNGSAQWAILADGDGDLDGLADVYEVQLGMDMYEPDVWGTRTIMPATQSLQGVMDAQAVGAFWQRVECQVYISPVFQDATHFLYADAVHGQFENFSIDGDPLSLANLTLAGFRGTSDQLVWLRDNEGAMQQVPENCLHYTDPGFLGQVGTGSHTIAYYQKSDPFQEPEIGFRDNFSPITILTDDSAANPAIDSDNDGLDDGMDRESLNALQWHPGTALRLAIPYTYEDRQDQADLQITLSISPPEHDYTTRSAPVAWHVGEGEDGTGVKCHIVPVVRCYGLGPAERDDYWYKGTTWGQFWGKNLIIESLVGVDASGNPYNAATAGLGFLPNPTNETKDTDLGDPANGYYYFLYPEQANKSWAYTLRIPSDHPLLRNNSKIPAVTFDFAWQVLEENPNNGTLSLGHIYDCLDNVTVQSAVATYVATAGSGSLRYILGKPASHAEYVALQSLAANPGCEVIQPLGTRPLNASIVKAEQGVGLLPKYHYDKNDLSTLSIADRIAHWREIYPRNPGDSEVVFYCGKEKTINLLQELAAGVQYDCHADPATVPGGEIQYADVPATWSFRGLADGTRSYNIDGVWDGGPWDGSENAQVITRARHFRKVLQLQPFTDAFSERVPAWASVDAGAPADNASVEFWLVLGDKGDDYTPDGILDITIADASDTIGPWLRFHGERMEYGHKDPATGETTFAVLDDVAVWPDEPIRVSIWYNCTNGTFFVDLGGVTFGWSNYVPFHDPANKPAALQVVNFTARYVPACIDAIGLTQVPQGSGDCGGAAYNRSNNAVNYAAWHAGDKERLVAWTQISNTSQGEIPPEQLQGDYNVLWGMTYTEQIHARREITFVSFPLQVKLTRASDANMDGFEISDHVEVVAAKGTTLCNSIPSKLSDIAASDINDERITFTRETTLAHASRIPSAEPPQVQFNDVFDAYFERDDLRERERDWWAAYYRPGTEKPASIDFTIIHTEEWYWDKTQLVRNLIELLVNDKLEVLQALQQAFGDPGTIWVERLLLKRNELQLIHVLEGQSFDPQTGLFSFGEPDAFGNYYFTWDAQPQVIPANQFLTTGPNAVVEFTEKGYAYFIRRFTTASCEEWARQVVDAFQTHAQYRAAFRAGGSMEMLWPVNFKPIYASFEIRSEILADFHTMSQSGLKQQVNIQNFISKWNGRFTDPKVNLPTISAIDDLFVDVSIKDVLKGIESGYEIAKPPILRPRQIAVDANRFAMETKYLATGKEGDSPITRRVGTWKYGGEAFIYPLPKGKFLIMPRATYEAIQPLYRAAFTIDKVLPGDKLRVNVLGYITHAPDVTLEMYRILGNHPALLQRQLAYFILTMEQVELMRLPNGMTGKAAIQQLGLWTKWKRVEGLLSGPKGAEVLADKVLGAYDPKANPSWQFASNLFLQYANILDGKSVSEVKGRNAKPFDRAQYNRDYYGSVFGQVSHNKLALLNLQTFSRPREEFVLTRLWERLNHWATIYATDHRAFGVSEFKACVLDLARSVAEDACLNYEGKTATPVLSILKNGYKDFPRNKDSIGSLVQLFGDEMGKQLLNGIEIAVPAISPQYSLEAKQKIEALYPAQDSQLPTREFIGMLLGRQENGNRSAAMQIGD